MDSKKNCKILFRLLLCICVGAIFVFVYQHFNPSKEWFLVCPIYKLTGLYCTGCGSQRTIHYLLNLEFAQSLCYNPLLVVFLPFFLYLAGVLLYNFILDKKYRPLFLYNNKIVYIILIIITLYTILRNIHSFPFSYLAPLQY